MNKSGYIKKENGSNNLILSFQSASKKSLNKFEWLEPLNRMQSDFDILCLKDYSQKWYLSRLRNIGKNIYHTCNFISKQTQKYKSVICIGSSMGGYASVLYGSLFNVKSVIAFGPQTDLKYGLSARKFNRLPNEPKKLYGNLKNVINGETHYYINTNGDYNNKLHSLHHYDNIKTDKKNVFFLSGGARDCLKSGKLKELILSEFNR